MRGDQSEAQEVVLLVRMSPRWRAAELRFKLRFPDSNLTLFPLCQQPPRSHGERREPASAEHLLHAGSLSCDVTVSPHRVWRSSEAAFGHGPAQDCSDSLLPAEFSTSAHLAAASSLLCFHSFLWIPYSPARRGHLC